MTTPRLRAANPWRPALSRSRVAPLRRRPWRSGWATTVWPRGQWARRERATRRPGPTPR